MLGIGVGLTDQVGRSGSDEWSPADLGADLLAIWDGDRSSSLNLSGGNVGDWTDTKSGYVVTQALSGNKPAYSATGLNGHGAVTGDDVDDRLNLAPVPAPLIAAGIEVWILCNQPLAAADTTARALLYFGGTTQATRITLYRTAGGGNNRLNSTVGNGSSSGSMVCTEQFAGIGVARLEVGATQSRLTLNGLGAVTVAVVPNISNTRLSMFSQNGTSGASYSPFGVNTVIFTKTLSAENAALLMAYLKARGGIA